MDLIVESGATKASWCLLGEGGFRTVETRGINLAHMDQCVVAPVAWEALEKLGVREEDISRVYFYAAGLIDRPDLPVFRAAKVEYASDLVAAARAVCGREPGIAAILGTGSNSCEWDGEKIVANFHGAGFILGDEGSASALGKAFVSDFLKDLVPEGIAAEFSSRFPSDYSTIVRNVYKGDAPAGYLGSFAPFIMDHFGDPYVRELARENFRSFIRRTLLRYRRLPVGAVGGFGYAYQDILREVAAEEGVEIRTVIKSPLDGLVNYHGL